MPESIVQAIKWAALPTLAALFAMVGAAVTAADTSNFRQMAAQEGGRWAGRVLAVTARPTLFVLAMDMWSGFLWLWAAFDIILHMGSGVGGLRIFSVLPAQAAGYRLRPSATLAATAASGAAAVWLLQWLPRRVGARRPLGVLRVLFWPAWALSMPLRPLCWLIDRLSLPGLRAGPETEEASEAEILDLIDRGEELGAIDETEKEMIENVFALGNLEAEDIMVPRTDMVVVWEEDTEAEILATIRQSGLTRFPVCRENVDDIIGVLSVRDFLLNYRADPPRPLSALLRPAYFVPGTVKADALFREMQRKKTHMAIVVDEYGGASGLLTMEDLLEQLVGEIYDEFDSEDEQEIIALDGGVWRIRGSADLEAVSRAVGVEIPESAEYDTLGGLIFSGLTVIPQDGSHPEVTAFGLRMVVEEISERRVEWVRVEKPGPEPENGR